MRLRPRQVYSNFHLNSQYNSKGLSKDVFNSFLAQLVQKCQIIKVWCKKLSILLHKSEALNENEIKYLPWEELHSLPINVNFLSKGQGRSNPFEDVNLNFIIQLNQYFLLQVNMFLSITHSSSLSIIHQKYFQKTFLDVRVPILYGII